VMNHFDYKARTSIICVLNPIGLGRSVQALLILPGLICSKPITKIQSAAPDRISVLAMCKPVLPVAQALLVL